VPRINIGYLVFGLVDLKEKGKPRSIITRVSDSYGYVVSKVVSDKNNIERKAIAS
jgi:hypothetical protein